MIPAQLVRRICDIVASATMGLALIVVSAVAVGRNLLGFTPIWTEPVVGLLVFISVCAAIPAGLRDGVHVSLHVLDRMGVRTLYLRDIAGQVLSLALGLGVAASALLYAQDMFDIGLTDYADIPDGLPALVGALFGLILAAVSLARLIEVIRRKPAS